MCGYSLERADRIFGTRDVEFTRVLDEAGALTHQDRQDLLRTLEDLERNIPPAALCIYITAHGQAQDFRTLAHWMINHAHIHHPSFGKREKMRAIEDAAFAERIPGEARERTRPAPDTAWQRLRKAMRDILHPYPPPVHQEWMLMLVLDVQLEIACFSWGYMLDPYINPDSINSCILGARLQFRERAMAVGLKKVMKAAVSQIAAQSHRINRRIRRTQPLPLVLAGLSLLAPAAWALPQSAPRPDDAPPPAQQAAEPTPAPKSSGAAADYDHAPRWDEADYRHLLSGELGGCYSMLSGRGSSRPPSADSTQTRRNRPAAESDTRIPKHYYAAYGSPSPAGLIDPQRLFSALERADIEHTLKELNAGQPYRLYAAVHRRGQEVPLELAVGALVRSVAPPGEYAVMLMYGAGDTPQIELGAHELQLSDERRHVWLERIRQAAVTTGGGDANGLIAALHELHACLAPVVEDLPPLTRQAAVNIPLIPIEMRDSEEKNEISVKDRIRSVVEDPAMQPFLITLGSILGCVVLIVLFFLFRRRSGRLLQTSPDIRLASPYGAGVSRNVRYLEGREIRKAPRPV